MNAVLSAAVESSVAPTRTNQVHIILQGKGGVGKSFVALLLCQYLRDRGHTVHPIDADPVNPTLSSFTALDAKKCELLDGAHVNSRRFDSMFEQLMTADGSFVIDTGSSAFVPFTAYMAEIDLIDQLRSAGRDVHVHSIIVGDQSLHETLRGFVTLAEQAPDRVLSVWINEFFGRVQREEKHFGEMRAFQLHADKIRGVVQLPPRNADTFGADIGEMTRQHLTFAEVMTSPGWMLAAKARLKRVQADIYRQLDTVKY